MVNGVVAVMVREEITEWRRDVIIDMVASTEVKAGLEKRTTVAEKAGESGREEDITVVMELKATV